MRHVFNVIANIQRQTARQKCEDGSGREKKGLKGDGRVEVAHNDIKSVDEREETILVFRHDTEVASNVVHVGKFPLREVRKGAVGGFCFKTLVVELDDDVESRLGFKVLEKISVVYQRRV